MAAYPDSQILDITGPLEVFASANRRLNALGSSAPRYEVVLLARKPGRIATSVGIDLMAHGTLRDFRGLIDTLMAPGGIGSAAALEDRELIGWLAHRAKRARRVASVCTGTFLLAEAGLLDGRTATTHWSACEQLAARYPSISVDPDPIFVKDGKFFSSAGVTAGMDLALALVEEDHGRELALTLARWLVIFLKRPGGQSQFSAYLRTQLAEREPVRDLQAWIVANPKEDLAVPALARRAGMSPRNFARVFTREVGSTPARFVESARLEAARRLLEETSEGVDEVAAESGFGSSEAMRRAFDRGLQVSPSDYRRRFACIAV